MGAIVNAYHHNTKNTLTLKHQDSLQKGKETWKVVTFASEM